MRLYGVAGIAETREEGGEKEPIYGRLRVHMCVRESFYVAGKGACVTAQVTDPTARRGAGLRRVQGCSLGSSCSVGAVTAVSLAKVVTVVPVALPGA